MSDENMKQEPKEDRLSAEGREREEMESFRRYKDKRHAPRQRQFLDTKGAAE